MSEYSESYHIRTDDPARVKGQLRKAGLAGVVFGPANGWLTFIPYEDHRALRTSSLGEGLTRALSYAIDGAVLHYSYGEDHGWRFALAQPGKPVGTFACWWDPEPSVERDNLDDEALAVLASSEMIRPLLREFDVGTAAQQKPAYQFAEVLRLPAYKWLSPHLAQHHTEDLIAQGGRKLGTKPPSTAQRLKLPPSRKIPLPRPDLSAREALDLARPFTSKFGPRWFLASLFGGGRVKPDGRLEPGVGVWQFTFTKNNGADFIHASLYFNGNLAFRGDTVPNYLATQLPEATELPASWLDSTDVAQVVAGEPFLAGLNDEYSLSMSLRPMAHTALWWEVTRTFVTRSDVLRMARHNFAIDATTGEILAESFERRERGRVVEARERLRWEGGDWKSITGNDRQ